MSDTRHPAVIVHNAAHVRLAHDTAVRLGVTPVLLTPPGAAAYAGVAYLKALVGQAPRLDAILDCGGEAGLAMAAIRAGWRDIHMAGDAEIVSKIDDMLSRIGGRLHPTLPPALDLGAPGRPETRLETWLNP